MENKKGKNKKGQVLMRDTYVEEDANTIDKHTGKPISLDMIGRYSLVLPAGILRAAGLKDEDDIVFSSDPQRPGAVIITKA